MGHELQRSRPNVHGGRSTEVSNEIFPLHVQHAWAASRSLARHPDAARTDHAGACAQLRSAQ